MGLFDLFKKKNEDGGAEQSASEPKAEKPKSSSPWPKKFRGFRDWEDDKKKAVGIEFLEEVGTRFQKAKVKEMLDEDDLELRGRYDDVPVRLQYELDMGWVSLEAKCNSPIQGLTLQWDLEKVPVHSDDDDDDWDDDDEVRVFVGKGIFVEGEKSEVNNILAQFASLPAELQTEIIETMQRVRLNRFFVFAQMISVGFDDNSYEMSDPLNMIEEAVALMAKTAKTVSRGEVVVGKTSSGGAQVAIQPVNLVTCSYCTTKFNLGANSRCPNCGASFTA